MSSTPPEQPVEDPEITAAGPIEVRHRRAPRYGRFITAGLLVGAIISFVTAIITWGWSELTPSNSFWVLMIYLAPTGMIVGAIIAFVMDRRSVRQMDRQHAAGVPTPQKD